MSCCNQRSLQCFFCACVTGYYLRVNSEKEFFCKSFSSILNMFLCQGVTVPYRLIFWPAKLLPQRDEDEEEEEVEEEEEDTNSEDLLLSVCYALLSPPH